MTAKVFELGVEQLNHRFIREVNPWVVHLSSGARDNQLMVSAIGQVIREALRAGGQTQAWLAERCGVSENAVSKWIRTGKISRENLSRISRELHLPIASLIPGCLAPEMVGENVSTYAARQSNVPLISWVQAGGWIEATEPYAPGDYDRMIPCLARHGPHAYALRVDGDSMTSPTGRSYPEGSIIFVDPDKRNARVGDRVIAKINGSDLVTFKQLAADGNRHYLKPLNSNHKPIFEEFRVIGIVIGMWMDE